MGSLILHEKSAGHNKRDSSYGDNEIHAGCADLASSVSEQSGQTDWHSHSAASKAKHDQLFFVLKVRLFNTCEFNNRFFFLKMKSSIEKHTVAC